MGAHSISSLRWMAKKGARLAVGGASLPLLALPAHRARLRVLTYHRFARAARSPFSVAPSVLERQMAWLAEAGLAATTADAADIAAGLVPGRHGVVVTMDDGDPSVIDAAAEIFQAHAIPFAVYVVPGRIGRADHMSSGQLRELAGIGAEIGSHGMTHRSVAGLAPGELRHEIEDSRKAIEDIIGSAVTSFAYPFGTLRDFDAAAGAAIVRAGYRIAFTSQHGAVVPGTDPAFAPRVKIEGGDPDWLFRAACAGAMDQWRFVDRLMSGLQKPAEADIARPEGAADTAR